MNSVKFNNKTKPFFAYLNARVEHYFTANNLKKTGNRKLYIKSFILIAAAITTYIILISLSMHPVIALLLCSVFGIIQAAIGFNVMHDANHGSFSEIKWVNNIMGLTANLMGVNAWMWKQKHNIIHHTYTNIDGIDDDIAKTKLLRMCPTQEQLKVHRYQHLYCLGLYSLTSLLWTFVTDFSKYFGQRIHSTSLLKMKPREHTIFWLSKIIYLLIFIGIPMYFLGFLPVIIGFIVMHMTLGITLALVFQLAHIVESTHFSQAGTEPLQIEEEWAVHQVMTTADFAPDNKVISWFTGGLNYQVEHHLYPKISHIHYPEIHKLVKAACTNFSLKLNCYPSMTAALTSHFRFMKRMGKQ